MKLIRVLSLLPLAAILVAWLGLGLSFWRQEQARLHIIEDVRELLQKDTRPQQTKPLERRGKVLVWDVTAGKPHPAQNQLPERLRSDATGGPITVVGVVSVARELAFKYDNGEPAYRLQATVRVVYWPEKTSAGTFLVMGEDPPFLAIRDKDDKEPVCGDLNKPLVAWITGLPTGTD